MGRRSIVAVLILLLGTRSGPAQPAMPLFEYRVLLASLRKAPGNTAERVAQDLRALVPADIRDHAAVSLCLSSAGYNYLDGDTPLAFAKRFDSQGYRFFVEIADPGIPNPPSQRIWLRPEQIAEILAACPNCLGVETGETFWAFTGGANPRIDRWLLDVLAACAARRRWFILGEGTWNKGHWTAFLARNHAELAKDGLGQWLVPMYKNTKPWAALQNVSAMQGAWLTGLVGQWGLWNDEWTWTYSSFGQANEFPAYRKADENQRKVPYTFFLRQWLWAISQGGGWCATENPLCFSREGQANSSFTKYLHPFIKGLADHRIVPRPEAVRARARAMVDPFGVYDTPAGPWTYDPLTVFLTYLDQATPFAPKSFDPFTVLYRNTFGFSPEYDGTSAAGGMFPREPSLPDRLTRETMPNSGRYAPLPILPYGDAPMPAGMARLRLNQMRTAEAVHAALDALFPADPAGVTAYQMDVDDSLFVLNGNENRDQDQHFDLRLGQGQLLALRGDLPFQNLVFGKREGLDRYWFQTNGYHGDGVTAGQRYQCPARPTVLTFVCRRAPTLTVEDDRGARLRVVEPWSAATQTVTLSFDHTDGAVSFTISG